MTRRNSIHKRRLPSRGWDLGRLILPSLALQSLASVSHGLNTAGRQEMCFRGIVSKGSENKLVSDQHKPNEVGAIVRNADNDSKSQRNKNTCSGPQS